MNNLNVNESQLGKKLKGITDRKSGESPEEAAVRVVQHLTIEENATLVAIATESLVSRSKVLQQPEGDLHHG